jgi:hypothetical protein
MLNSDGKRFPSKDKSVISMLLGYLPGDRLWESFFSRGKSECIKGRSQFG